MPAPMSKMLSHAPSPSPSTARRPVAAAFARNPGHLVAQRTKLCCAQSSSLTRSSFAASCSSSTAADNTSSSSGGSTGLGQQVLNGEAFEAQELDDGDDGLTFVQLSSGILRIELSLLNHNASPPTCAAAAASSIFSTLPTLHEGGDTKHREDAHLEEASTAAYPAAINALYAACLAGNATEQLWNFTWPAAVATLHPTTLLPVAAISFFTKLVVFAAGPLVGEVLSSLPLIPTYRALAVIQTAAHLVSAAAIMYAFTASATTAASPTAPALLQLLLRQWFAVLAASTAVDTLSCVALGIVAEREFVVQLAGEGRPVALAQANATLSRVDLLCETVGASIFAFLISKNDALTCIKLSCVMSICALPVLIFLGGEMNRLADGIFDHSEHTGSRAASAFSIGKTVAEAVGTIRHGWSEYVRQPVLPASLAYVLVCFNVALAPGALMTTFLIHQGVSPSVIGAFGGSSAVMGILATFITANLVQKLGILKAGAAGLIAQSALLADAVLVYLATGSISRRGNLFIFLGLIVASRVGHMAYSAIGLQVVQTGNPAGKAKLIGATEVAVGSLAELAMMAVAVVAGDASHFGALAVLSAAAVAGAACLYCHWLANPTDELRQIFPS